MITSVDPREALATEIAVHRFTRLGLCACGVALPGYGDSRGPDPMNVARHLADVVESLDYRPAHEVAAEIVETLRNNSYWNAAELVEVAFPAPTDPRTTEKEQGR